MPKETSREPRSVQRLVMPLTEGNKWRCVCGIDKHLGAWVAAHWDERLMHECACGRQYDLLRGVITLRHNNIAERRPSGK